MVKFLEQKSSQQGSTESKGRTTKSKTWDSDLFVHFFFFFFPCFSLLCLIKRYVKLYADGTRLESIPPEIYKMEALEVLWLTGNKLTTLPDEITWLIKLENLRLDRNRIEVLPKCIGRLPNLTHLGLNKNRLRSLPPELANLTKLESLYLAENPGLPEHQNQDFRTKEETQAFLKTLLPAVQDKKEEKQVKKEAPPMVPVAMASSDGPIIEEVNEDDSPPMADVLD